MLCPDGGECVSRLCGSYNLGCYKAYEAERLRVPTEQEAEGSAVEPDQPEEPNHG